MKCVAIIPARGGSQRIPLKNIKPFHGKPIIAYSINAAIDSRLFDRVIVSTDSQAIADVAKMYGAEVIMRSEEMSRDEVGTQDVMAHVLSDKDIECEYACCIYPCAPMLTTETLQAAYNIMKCEYSIQPIDSRKARLIKGNYVVPVATWLRDPGQFYFGWRVAFIERRPLIGIATRMMQIDPATECDINTDYDWVIAERMYAELHRIEDY